MKLLQQKTKLTSMMFKRFWNPFSDTSSQESEDYSVRDIISTDDQSLVHPEVAKVIAEIQRQLPHSNLRDLDAISLALVDAAVYLHSHRVQQALQALYYIHEKDRDIELLIAKIEKLVDLPGTDAISLALAKQAKKQDSC